MIEQETIDNNKELAELKEKVAILDDILSALRGYVVNSKLENEDQLEAMKKHIHKLEAADIDIRLETTEEKICSLSDRLEKRVHDISFENLTWFVELKEQINALEGQDFDEDGKGRLFAMVAMAEKGQLLQIEYNINHEKHDKRIEERIVMLEDLFSNLEGILKNINERNHYIDKILNTLERRIQPITDSDQTEIQKEEVIAVITPVKREGMIAGCAMTWFMCECCKRQEISNCTLPPKGWFWVELDGNVQNVLCPPCGESAIKNQKTPDITTQEETLCQCGHRKTTHRDSPDMYCRIKHCACVKYTEDSAATTPDWYGKCLVVMGDMHCDCEAYFGVPLGHSLCEYCGHPRLSHKKTVEVSAITNPSYGRCVICSLMPPVCGMFNDGWELLDDCESVLCPKCAAETVDEVPVVTTQTTSVCANCEKRLDIPLIMIDEEDKDIEAYYVCKECHDAYWSIKTEKELTQ